MLTCLSLHVQNQKLNQPTFQTFIKNNRKKNFSNKYLTKNLFYINRKIAIREEFKTGITTFFSDTYKHQA